MNPPDIPRTPPAAVNRPAGRPGPARFLARLMELIDRWPLRSIVRLPVKSGRLPLARRLIQWLALALTLTLTLIGAAGCVQAVERPGIETPTPVVILVPAPTPAPTATPFPTPPPAPTPTPLPTPRPTPVPPPITPPTPPAPTVPTAPTAPPAATATPAPTPAPTPEPTPVNAPFLNVQEPLDRSIVRQDTVTVRGLTQSGVSVSIRGRAVAAGESGRFQITIPISPGVNLVDVNAIDAEGNRNTQTLTITFLPPDPFFLTIAEPRDAVTFESTIRLWGRTAADATVTVNGVAIPVDQLGIFSTTVALRPGDNRIYVDAVNPQGLTRQEQIDVTLILLQP